MELESWVQAISRPISVSSIKNGVTDGGTRTAQCMNKNRCSSPLQLQIGSPFQDLHGFCSCVPSDVSLYLKVFVCLFFCSSSSRKFKLSKIICDCSHFLSTIESWLQWTRTKTQTTICHLNYKDKTYCRVQTAIITPRFLISIIRLLLLLLLTFFWEDMIHHMFVITQWRFNI